MQCGFYLQYIPGIVPEHIHAMRSELAAVCGERARHGPAEVCFVLSFSQSALEAFSAALSTAADTTKPIVVWLFDSPSTPYGDDVNEGETTFDCTSESFAASLERTDLSERVRRLPVVTLAPRCTWRSPRSSRATP